MVISLARLLKLVDVGTPCTISSTLEALTRMERASGMRLRSLLSLGMRAAALEISLTDKMRFCSLLVMVLMPANPSAPLRALRIWMWVKVRSGPLQSTAMQCSLSVGSWGEALVDLGVGGVSVEGFFGFFAFRTTWLPVGAG